MPAIHVIFSDRTQSGTIQKAMNLTRTMKIPRPMPRLQKKTRSRESRSKVGCFAFHQGHVVVSCTKILAFLFFQRYYVP